MAGATTAGTALLLSILSVVIYMKHKPQRNPPGPKPLPLIGNILDFPLQFAWLTYDKWKKQYGDVVHMNILGTPIVILNSLKACTDLFDTRGAIYCSRPRMVMMCELMGWDAAFVLMPYTPRWRRHRRLFHQHFNEAVANSYKPVQQQGTYTFLQQLHKEPERLCDHIRFLFGNTVMDLTYGIKAQSTDDILLKQAEETVRSAMSASVPGQYLVDVFPLLKYIPSWFPGAGFKKQAAVWKKLGENARGDPFTLVRDRMSNGTTRPCVVTSMFSKLDDNTSNGEEYFSEIATEAIKDCAATAYLAGFDTMTSSIQAFFLAIANNVQVQKSAQKELDAVLGGSRLPDFEDANDLPFVRAIIKELLRWHNPLPLAIAHCLTEDDEYNGYFLRKGTVVLGNAWSILHDPEVYPDPLTFNPWRWLIDTPEGIRLNDTLPDPSLSVFGFGRRTCPGSHFANNSLFIVVANVLACYDIRPLDSKRQPVERLEERFTSGLISYPEPFNISVTPRSEQMRQLLREIVH